MVTFIPVVIVLMLVLVSGTVVAARRPTLSLPARLGDVQRATARWRTGGLLIGIVVAALAQTVRLGQGLLLAAPLLAMCVLLGVVAGELRVMPPPMAERAAVLEVRRVRDYLPRRLAGIVLGTASLLGLLLVATTAAGASDDLGRPGRSLFRRCSALTSESHGPWPGSFYSVPVALVVGLGLLVAGVALRQLVRRPRQGADLAADDALRHRAAQTVTAGAGLLVAVPFAGVALLAGVDLRGTSCAPATWTLAGTALLLLVPVLVGLAAWCTALLLTAGRLPAAIRR